LESSVNIIIIKSIHQITFLNHQSTNQISLIMSTSIAFLIAYLSPLLTSPVITGIELVLIVSLLLRKRVVLVAFLLALILTVNVVVPLTGPLKTQKAVWARPLGGELFVHEHAVTPRALVPGVVIVKVKNAALNPADHKVFAHLPSIPVLRWFVPHAFAHDVAGIVVESSCAKFKQGDEVYGFALGGSLQEYTWTPCRGIAMKPKPVAFEKAAALPVALSSAYVGLKPVMQPGKSSVLVIGSAGGCGSVGVSLVKSMGATKVWCVASGRNEKVSRSVGCDEFYDYMSKDFETAIVKDLQGKVDVVYDTVSSHEDFDYYDLSLKLLRPETGHIVALNGGPRDWAANLFSFLSGGSQALARPRRTLVFGVMTPEMYDDLAAHHVKAMQSVVISPPVSAFDVANVKKGEEGIKSRRTTGKFVLSVP